MMVDIDRAREALRTLVAIAFKRHDAPFPRFHIPAQKTDDDVVLGDALRELVELRARKPDVNALAWKILEDLGDRRDVPRWLYDKNDEAAQMCHEGVVAILTAALEGR